MSERVRIEENDHLLGRRDAEVVLVEYADFQCPYCRRAHDALTALRAEHGERLALAYRHLPLSHLHPDAQAAAEAAEAAGEAGKFWEMHDALFANQDRLDEEALPSMAAALGMDGERVRADLEGGRFRARVRKLPRVDGHWARAGRRPSSSTASAIRGTRTTPRWRRRSGRRSTAVELPRAPCQATKVN